MFVNLLVVLILYHSAQLYISGDCVLAISKPWCVMLQFAPWYMCISYGHGALFSDDLETDILPAYLHVFQSEVYHHSIILW